MQHIYYAGDYMRTTLSVVLSLGLLSACGGGGDDDPAQQPAVQDAAGFYRLSSNKVTSATVIYGDGTYYSIYGLGEAIDGFITGSGVSRNGSFTSTNARDYYAGGTQSATLSASYEVKRSISGSVTYTAPARTVPFSGNYDAIYETRPTLASITGSFRGTAASPQGAEMSTVEVNSSGGFAGRGLSGCTFSGTATPKSSGYGFDVALSFAGAPCTYPNQLVRGAALVFNSQLVVMVSTADRNGALLFVGSR
jgi:hypothetical protein